MSHFTTNPVEIEHPILVRLRRLSKGVGILEGWLSVFFTAVVTLFGVIGPIALFYWKEHEPVQNASVLFWSVCWFTLDLPYQFRLFATAIRNRRPVAYHAAAESRMLPIFLRPIVVFWWLTHFAVGALAETMLHLNGSKHRDGTDIFLAFGMGMAANGYLMLAVCAATESVAVRNWVWKFRLAIDLILGITAAVFVRS